MNFLETVFWVILLLTSGVMFFGPPAWPNYYRFSPVIALLAILGFKVFHTELK